jgi:molybdopterin molybdotransferase
MVKSNLETAMKLIGIKEAQSLIQENVRPLESIQVSLQGALGCVLASDVVAMVDSPSVDASLKDGFAVRSTDLAGADSDGPIRLELVGLSMAGGQVPPGLESGQTIRVMTGAPLPPQADAVVPVEQVTEEGDGIRFSHSILSGEDILPKGSDVAQNQRVATAGEIVTPGLLGLLAASGYNTIDVVRPPRVAIISTGDEVVAPGRPLPPGKLYASNLTTLDAWCRKLGFGTRCIIVGDNVAETTQSIEDVSRWADAVITSGGAWGSERDIVAGALETLNWQQLFYGVRLRPGKGSGFGLLADKPVFMLPGGPSANLTAFLQMALPGLQQMAGRKRTGLPEVVAALDSEIKNRHGDWTKFVLGQLRSEAQGFRFEPLDISSRLLSIAKAEAMAVFTEGEAHVLAGSTIRVQILDF